MKNDDWNILPALEYLAAKWKIFIEIIMIILIISFIIIHFFIPKKYEAVSIITPVSFDISVKPGYTALGYKIPFEEETQLMLEILESNRMKSLIIEKYPEVHTADINFGRTENYQIFIKAKDKISGNASQTVNFIAEQYNALAQQDTTHTFPMSVAIDKASLENETIKNPHKISLYISIILLTTMLTSLLLLLKRKQENGK